MQARLNLIFARSLNGVIGREGKLPWHLPEDLAHFKRTTLGWPVIMGRRTWDSLPPKFRPLPGRPNIVVTRQSDWNADGALVAHDLGQALEACAPAAEVWVIGGAQLYALALPRASTVIVTEIDVEIEGDAYAPSLDDSWVEVSRERHVSATGLSYSFLTYARKG